MALQGTSGRGRYGGLLGTLLKQTKSVLKANGNFHEDSVYLCGEPILEPAHDTVCFVLSTDNLLLNAYRQTLFGVPSYVQIDTTHRVVSEGHCVMPIMTVDLQQRTHPIAFGICSDESVAAHRHVIEQTKMAVEAVVAERAANNEVRRRNSFTPPLNAASSSVRLR